MQAKLIYLYVYVEVEAYKNSDVINSQLLIHTLYTNIYVQNSASTFSRGQRDDYGNCRTVKTKQNKNLVGEKLSFLN